MRFPAGSQRTASLVHRCRQQSTQQPAPPAGHFSQTIADVFAQRGRQSCRVHLPSESQRQRQFHAVVQALRWRKRQRGSRIVPEERRRTAIAALARRPPSRQCRRFELLQVVDSERNGVGRRPRFQPHGINQTPQIVQAADDARSTARSDVGRSGTGSVGSAEAAAGAARRAGQVARVEEAAGGRPLSRQSRHTRLVVGGRSP